MPSSLSAIPTMEQIDHRISLRLRQRRLLLGVTQSALAYALGVSFQQIQKYETGANRISSARLFELSLILDVPITYFYRQVRVSTGAIARLLEDKDLKNKMRRAETLSLIRNYYLIEPRVRKTVASMCRSLAPSEKRTTDKNKKKN